MNRIFIVCAILAGCTQNPVPAKEAIQPQLVARVGFLLEQIAIQETEAENLRKEVARLQVAVADAHAATRAAQAGLVLAIADSERLRDELAARDETIRLRAKQIVATFSRDAACERERDACVEQLANATLPGSLSVNH